MTRPVIFSLGLLAGLALSLALMLGFGELSPDAAIPVTSHNLTPTDQSPTASRARYLNARGTLDRAWGDWNIAFHDPLLDRYFVIVGIDTKSRCDETVKVLTAHFKDREGPFDRRVAVCYETVGKGE